MESGAENNNANSIPTPDLHEKKADDFETRLKAIKNADFAYIFVFRRKDGGEFTAEDKQFLRTAAQPEPNRWEVPGDKKAVIAGTNFPFPEEVLQNLRTRFNVEDHSMQ